MNIESIFQYLIHDLQSMGNEATILPANEQIKRASVVFENPEGVLKEFTSLVQCVEAGEVMPDVQILRFVTNLNVVSNQDTQALALSLDHIYPLFRFIASDEFIFARLDIPFSVHAIWESPYMTKLVSFYQAIIAYNAPVFKELEAGKLNLKEATAKTRKN